MKKLFTLFIFLLLYSTLPAQVFKSAKAEVATKNVVTIYNPTAGGLASAIATAGFGPLPSITSLTVTGNLNSVDFTQMRNNMSALTTVDISGVALASNTLPANAFQGKTTLTSILLPANLQTIGNYAFEGCTALTGNVPLPASLITIGSYAFQNCQSLTGNLSLPTTVTSVGSSAFINCKNLNGTLNLGTSLVTIGGSAFYGCYKLTGSLTLPSTVKTIGNYAFYNCYGLTGSLTIPNSVTSLGSYAFAYCSGFNSNLTLPNAISSLNYATFSGCSGLTGTVNIPISVTTLTNSSSNPGCFQDCSKITEVVFSTNTLSIGDNAFNGCTSLTKVTVPCSNPPIIYVNTFTGVNYLLCWLNVPSGATSAYQKADYWANFSLLNENAVADTYGISVQIGANGTVTENGIGLGNGSVVSALKDAVKTFTFIPSTGYEIATLLYNNVDIKSQVLNNTYTTAAISTNSELSITFKKTQYKLSIRTGSSGTTNLFYEYGATPSFDFSPSTGWKIQAVYFNNNDVTNSLINGIYTTPPISGNSSLSVTFINTATNIDNFSDNKVKAFGVGSNIIVEGLELGEKVALYTLNGQLISETKSDSNRLTIPAKSGAIYILKTNKNSFKIKL